MTIRDDGYFIRLEKESGFLGIKREKIQDFPFHETLMSEMKKQPPGDYYAVTYWDGRPVNSVDIEVREDGVVLLGGYTYSNYQDYREYVYALARVANIFSSEEKTKSAAEYIKRYQEEHKPPPKAKKERKASPWN